MTTLLGQGFPLRQVVRTLLLDVGLCVCTVGTMELLCDGILDFDGLDLFIERREGVAPD